MMDVLICLFTYKFKCEHVCFLAHLSFIIIIYVYLIEQEISINVACLAWMYKLYKDGSNK